MQAGHESLRDIAFVVPGCTEPKTQSSLWNSSIEVVIIRYKAITSIDAVLCNLNCFFEEPDIFSD